VVYNTVKWFRSGSAGPRNSLGNSLRNCYTWDWRAATAAVSKLQGLMKEAVLAFENVRPYAACETYCLEGSIERPK
jgi:hypothetical protein